MSQALTGAASNFQCLTCPGDKCFGTSRTNHCFARMDWWSLKHCFTKSLRKALRVCYRQRLGEACAARNISTLRYSIPCPTHLATSDISYISNYFSFLLNDCPPIEWLTSKTWSRLSCLKVVKDSSSTSRKTILLRIVGFKRIPSSEGSSFFSIIYCIMAPEIVV